MSGRIHSLTGITAPFSRIRELAGGILGQIKLLNRLFLRPSKLLFEGLWHLDVMRVYYWNSFVVIFKLENSVPKHKNVTA